MNRRSEDTKYTTRGLSKRQNLIRFYCDVTNVIVQTLRTYCEDVNDPSRPFAQQVIQLLFGDGVHNETEDEEGRKDNTQSPTQERVKADAFVVGHISPACTQRNSGFNITFSAAGNICRLLSAPYTHDMVYLFEDATCHFASK